MFFWSVAELYRACLKWFERQGFELWKVWQWMPCFAVLPVYYMGFWLHSCEENYCTQITSWFQRENETLISWLETETFISSLKWENFIIGLIFEVILSSNHYFQGTAVGSFYILCDIHLGIIWSLCSVDVLSGFLQL